MAEGEAIPITVQFRPTIGGIAAKHVIFNSNDGDAVVPLRGEGLAFDSDSDGVPDDEDSCPNSDISDTVVVDGCDSGVANLNLGGCTISDQIAEIAADARNHGQFVRGVAKLLNQLRNDGVIRDAERGAIQRCAAQSRHP